MSDSTFPASEPNPASTSLEEPGVLWPRSTSLGAVESLVEICLYFLASCQRQFDLLGFAVYQHKPDPTTGNFDCGSGYWDLDLCYVPDCITTAVHRLGLQPHEPRPGHVGVSSALHGCARYSFMLEWHVVPCRTGPGSGGAPPAPPDRSVWTRSKCFVYLGLVLSQN